MIFTTEQALLSILVVLTSCSSAMANQNYNQQIISRIHSTKYPVFHTTSRRQQQQTTNIASIISPSSALLLVNLRGGSGSFCTPSPFLDMEAEESSDEEQEEDDDYMDDIDEDEGAAMHQQRQRQNLKSTSSHRQPSERSEVDPDPFHRKAPYLARKKKKKNVLSRMATSSLSLTKKAATTTVKTSGKAAFYLMRPKAIQESELWGVWRLDQQVGMKQCTANIELTKRGDVVVRSGNNIIWKARYRFVQPTWPQSCRIEFEAPAFQPPNSKKSWMLRYKGTIERKMADKSVLKIVGTLYDIERPKGMFGKELPTRYNKIGSFVGRRRVVLLEEDDDDDDDDNSEEYSEMEEDDEEGMYDQHVGNEGPEEVVDPEDDPYYGDPYYGESGGDEEEYDDRRM